MLGPQNLSNRRPTSRAPAQKNVNRAGPGGSLVQLRGIVRVLGTLHEELRTQSMQLPIQRPALPLSFAPPATTNIVPPLNTSSPSPTATAVSDVRSARTPPGPEEESCAQHPPLQSSLSSISSPSPERNVDPQRRYSLAVPTPAGPSQVPLRTAAASGRLQYSDACTDTPDSDLNPFLLCDPVCSAFHLIMHSRCLQFLLNRFVKRFSEVKRVIRSLAHF